MGEGGKIYKKRSTQPHMAHPLAGPRYISIYAVHIGSSLNSVNVWLNWTPADTAIPGYDPPVSWEDVTGDTLAAGFTYYTITDGYAGHYGINYTGSGSTATGASYRTYRVKFSSKKRN